MNSFGLSGLFSSISFSALAIVVLIHDYRSKLNIRFVMFLMGVAWWTWGVYKIVQAGSIQDAFFWWRIAHVGVILIPVVFLHFVYVLLELPKKTIVYISYCIGALFLIANATPYFISEMRLVFDSFYYTSPPGVIYSIFVIFFTYLVIYGHYLLFVSYRKASGVRRKQIFNIFLGGFIGFIGGMTAFLPVFKIDLYPAVGTSLISVYSFMIFYSMMKNQLFNVKIIVTEVLTITTWVFFITRIFFIPKAGGIIVDLFVTMILVILGVFAIKGALKETVQKEQLAALNTNLKDLNENLEDKVREQTKEIRRAYEVEKKARHDLEELDKAKTDFILTTQHHLRTPLTIVKGVANMFEDKQEGYSLSKTDTAFLDKLSSGANKLAKLINRLTQTIN